MKDRSLFVFIVSEMLSRGTHKAIKSPEQMEDV